MHSPAFFLIYSKGTMKYVGSKNKLAKELIPIINSYRKPGQVYVEPFVGGANIIDKLEGERIGNDIHEELIAFWKALQEGWVPPYDITEDEYQEIRYGDYPLHLKGYVGFNLSFSGKWWGGYARYVNPKTKKKQPFGPQAYRFVTKQIPGIKGIKFIHGDYISLDIPEQSLIYCDPPYKGTVKYKNSIDYLEFYDWCRLKHSEGHTVLVSEFDMPKDFTCIWSKERSVSLDVYDGKTMVEKLFVL
jgi:DNA adenine methylase